MKGSAYHLCASCHLGHANIKPSRPSASKTPSTHTHTHTHTHIHTHTLSGQSAIPQHREHNPYAPRCATFHHCNPPGPHLGTRRLHAPSRNSSIPSARGRFSTSLSLAHRNPPFLIQPRSCTLLQCLASFRPALPCLAHAAHIHKETPPPLPAYISHPGPPSISLQPRRTPRWLLFSSAPSSITSFLLFLTPLPFSYDLSFS